MKTRHGATFLVGTVRADALSPEPLMVNEGIFNLFVKNPDNVDTHNMRYRMKLSSQDGDHYYFYGYKVIHDDPGIDVWSDTTTLYITVYEGKDDQGPVAGLLAEAQ